MSSPIRSVTVRLGMDPSSYVTGAARAEASTLSLDRAVSKVGPNSATSMERAAKSADRTGSSFLSLSSITGRLGIGVGALAGLTGAAVVKMAGDYQQSVTKLATTAGESTKNLHMVSQGMLDMAGQVGVSAQELAKGMYTVESSGMHGADALLVLKAAAQGARQEQADLAHVTDAVTTSLHDYHLPASQAATVTSQLIAAVSHGKTTFDELTSAMHSVEPIAASAGMSIAQTAGALAAMTASGMHADQAAQNLASSIRSFEKPTGTMRDELYQLGLNAQDLSAHLGERGIAGTLQLVSDAIVRKMGPAGQVALDALNKNKAAAQDLVVMMKAMPPQLATLSNGLLDGSVSIAEYTKAAKGLGGQAGPMALQFESLYKSSNGFSSILKSGGPAVQTYIGALGKGVGTAEGLSVALQLTGENAAGTNKTIAAVGKAAATASGDIKGWDEVQGNFNQQLAQTEAKAKSLAIEAGTHLLPILTNGLSWINEHGDAALHSLGQGFTDVGHALQPVASAGKGALDLFKALPGPVQETVLALGALKVASSMGWLDGLSTGAGKIRGAFTSMSSEIGAAFTAAKANQVRMVTESDALWGEAAGQAEKFAGTNTSLWASTAKAVDEVGVSSGRSIGNVAGLGAAAKTAATQGLGLMKSAGSSLSNLLGGSLGISITGGAIAWGVYESAEQRTAAATQKLVTALAAGGKAAVDAQAQIDAALSKHDGIQNTLGGKTLNQGGLAGFAESLIPGINGLRDAYQREVKPAADATAEWQKQKSVMTQVEIGQHRLADAQYALAMAQKSGDPYKITTAYDELANAQTYLSHATNAENEAQKTQNQQLQDAADKALAARDATLALHLSNMQLNDAIAQYNKDAHDGQHTTQQLAEEQAQLAQQAVQVARSAGDAAAAQAKQNGATDTGITSNEAMLKSLQETAKHLTGPALDAVNGYIRDLQKSTTAAAITREAMTNLGLTVDNLPDSHLIQIDAPTAKQEAALHHLGYVTVTLPNGKVVVTADTNPAMTEIRDLLQYARTQAILYRATLPSLVDNTVTSGSGRMGTSATGGWISGPGTGTSDTAGVFALSNREFVVNAAAAAANGPLLEAINGGARVHSSGVAVPGYARGGWIGPPGNGSTAQIPVRIDPASVSAVDAALHAKLAAAAARATAFSGGSATASGPNAAVVQALANGYGWGSGAEWSALVSVINRESGFRNTAQNPTSTAYGMFQFLDSTWAGVGGYKTSDPRLQGIFGLRYLASRYGDPLGALRHEQAFGWYEKGTDYVPATGLAGLHQGEAVLTRSDNQALRSIAMRSREMTGGGRMAGPMVVHHHDNRSYPVAVQTADNPARIVKSLRDAQYQQEFLHG